MMVTRIQASRGDDQYMLRLPREMKDEIKASAKANGRSMNSEIIARLSGALQAEPIASKPPEDNGLGLIWEVENISRFLGLSARQTFHVLSNGELPAKKIGGKWVVHKDELREFFRATARD